MPAIYLRKANTDDLPEILDIAHAAVKHLGDQGIDQWQHGYPSDDDFTDDVKLGINYVLIYDGDIAGTATLHQGLDPNYLKIQDGEWKHGIQNRYTAIHRVAMSDKFRGKGLAKRMMSGLITMSGALGYRDVRVDTHPDNKGMQHVITSNGFEKRGIIHMREPDQPYTERYAYQLVIGEYK